MPPVDEPAGVAQDAASMPTKDEGGGDPKRGPGRPPKGPDKLLMVGVRLPVETVLRYAAAAEGQGKAPGVLMRETLEKHAP